MDQATDQRDGIGVVRFRRGRAALVLAGFVLAGVLGPALRAGERLAGMDDAAACGAAIATAQANRGVPDGLLGAIGRVESGRADPSTGVVAAWPWSVNANGVGQAFATKEEAVGAVLRLQERGVQSIDVGCMQINLRSHPDAFASLDEAFDPQVNADYAARFLLVLYGRSGSWMGAAMAYHSSTPELAAPYGARVAAAWSGSGEVGAVVPRALSAAPLRVEPGTMFPVALPAAFRAVMLPVHRAAARAGRAGGRLTLAVR